MDNGKPIDSGRGHYIVEKLSARCARRQVVEMMRPVSLDQCADRFAVGKVQSKHLDLLCRAAQLGPLLSTMRGADDLISFCHQQFCEIGTVLAEHPGDQRYLGIAFSHAAAPHRAASYKRLRGKPPTWATQRRSAEAAFRSI